jgi:DNA topoisomerase-1
MVSQKNLVIVESPAKAKTISKYLNSNRALREYGKFIVMSSKGHIRDLKKKDLSIDIAHDFNPQYEILVDKTALVKELKEKASLVDNVYLAADFDREGEAICEHLKYVLGLKKYHRITFTEITPTALEKAVKNPRQIDDDLVDAQETRRILDRLVGFKLSPLLWKTFNANRLNLSAGRVQSAALHIITQKENEVDSFTSKPYYYVMGNFNLKIGKEEHNLEDVRLYDNSGVLKFEGDNAFDETLKLLQKITLNPKQDFIIKEYKLRHLKQSPPLPFITSSLQQEAYAKLGFPVKRTMSLAQDLYEKGHITYMRTDSYNISKEFAEDAIKFVSSRYGQAYVGDLNKRSGNKKHAQEAHEAIRPTHIDTTVLDEQDTTKDHKKLYEFIWKRTVAFFMAPANFDELELQITDKSFPLGMYFKSSFKLLKFSGFLAVYGEKESTMNFDAMTRLLQSHTYNLKYNQLIGKNTWTSPPARYSEASIIKTLEADSIGRPSTFATILTKLFEKQYVNKTDVRGEDKQTKNILLRNNKIDIEQSTVTVGEERSKLVPTDVGKRIDQFLQDNFAYIIDKNFTAAMEDDLDKIAEHKTTRSHVLGAFWKTFGADVERIEQVKKEAKIKLKNEELKYTIDGKEYIVRVAKYGPVIQYSQGENTKYIDIKSYLKYTNKSYTNINEQDIKFLANLPKKVAEVKGKPVMLTSGPYGLYFKYDDNNVKIPLKFIKRMLDPEQKGSISQSEYESVINYKANQSIPKTQNNKNSQSTQKVPTLKRTAKVSSGKRTK